MMVIVAPMLLPSKTKSGKDVALYWVMKGSAMMKGP